MVLKNYGGKYFIMFIIGSVALKDRRILSAFKTFE